jgi:hypothetical protein
MADLIYHDHTIVSTGVYDEISRMWRLSSYVSWLEGAHPTRRYHFIRNTPDRFFSAQNAEMAGMERAKHWVDDHLRELG